MANPIRALFFALLFLFGAPLLANDAAPSKTVRIVVPYPPGGGNDVLARILAPKLSALWGQPVFIDNRPGANTVIGTDYVVKSPADGHTLLLVTGTHAINSVLTKLPYTAKDLAPVTALALTEFVLVASTNVKANNLAELVAWAKSNPGRLSYATSGTGAINHLVGERLEAAAGIQLQDIPYKGSGQIFADLIGGQVNLSFQTIGAIGPQLAAGKVKAIAISGKRRSKLLPDVPTFAEAGYPELDLGTWYGFVAKAGTPKATVDTLAKGVQQVLQMPQVQAELEGKAWEPFPTTPEAFGQIIDRDAAIYGRILRDKNISLE